MADLAKDETEQAVVEFGRNLLWELTGKYGGDCTLNEVRVMCQIISRSREGKSCSVTALHKVTNIPIPTVSRAVANLQIDGWLSDRPDPSDGRRRIISLGPRSLAGVWQDVDGCAQWISDYGEQRKPA